MPFANLTVTILKGQWLSSSIDCRSAAPVFIHTPTKWTTAPLGYQISPDDIMYSDLFDREGNEILARIFPGTVIRINPEWTTMAVGYIKLRSGPRNNPIAQDETRTFHVIVDTGV
jgi:hypothetical protein